MTTPNLKIAAGMAVAAAIALAMAWPQIRLMLIRRKPGNIEEGGYIYDPASGRYYRTDDGAEVWRP